MVSKEYPDVDEDEEASEKILDDNITVDQVEKGKRGASILSPLKRLKKKLYAETCQCITAIVVLSLVLAGCVVSFFYCNVCLVGVIIVSACMCPWIPYFNIPLWTSIVLLVFVGWNFSSRKFHFIWE
jgi:hypothetical protein